MPDHKKQWFNWKSQLSWDGVAALGFCVAIVFKLSQALTVLEAVVSTQAAQQRTIEKHSEYISDLQVKEASSKARLDSAEARQNNRPRPHAEFGPVQDETDSGIVN